MGISRERLNRLIVLVVTCFIFVALPVFSLITIAQADTDEIKTARKGVVCVVTISEDDKATGWGTGFSIYKGDDSINYIVTNYHVVIDAVESNDDIIIYHSRESNDSVEATVIAASESKDLAVLKTSKPVFDLIPLSILASKYVREAETVFALGFPGETLKESLLLSFNQSDISVTSGIISNRVIQLGTRCFQTDVPISAGDSGGPLVNRSGEVIGINSRSLQDNKNISYAIISDELVDLLDDHNILYVSAKNQTNWWNWLLVIILLLFLFILLKMLIHHRKARLSNQISKNNHPEVQNKILSTEQQVVTIYGLTGVFANNRIGLRTGKLFFGKDPTCHIKYPENYSQIADRHCVIFKDEKSTGFVLQDLGSFEGTYICEGVRLKPQQKVLLRDNEIFYLGDRQQMFRVKLNE